MTKTTIYLTNFDAIPLNIIPKGGKLTRIGGKVKEGMFNGCFLTGNYEGGYFELDEFEEMDEWETLKDGDKVVYVDEDEGKYVGLMWEKVT